LKQLKTSKLRWRNLRMALVSSGALSFSQIQTEFGGSNPISLSEYYKGGGLVHPSAYDPNSIPTSGVISVHDFHGSDQYTAPQQQWWYCSASGSGAYSTMSAGGYDYYGVGISDDGDPNSPFAGHAGLVGWIRCDGGTTNAVSAGVTAANQSALISALSTWDIHSSRGGTNNEIMSPTTSGGGTSFNGVPLWAWGVSRSLQIFGGSMGFSATVKKYF
jgi:hypothetical protein